ncbi:nicotinate-nucleotide diphosphorylase [Phycisphaerae bacterium]|jgi:nicotinate-nucleotide pyrophosphorylase (carboxylating)|nr:nicotinate-nucleotide diphosphorylase [Phycisphaerae bacterium]
MAYVNVNGLSLPDLYQRLNKQGLVQRLLELAWIEDLGSEIDGGPDEGLDAPYPGDITSDACIDIERQARAALRARKSGVVAGLAVIPDLVDLFCGDVRWTMHAEDGSRVQAGDTLVTLEGNAIELLRLERTMLNIVGRLSGIASLTATYKHAMGAKGATRAKLYDTRKTTPGLRVLEKYAVRCGGGFCHRIGLFDAMLIKDNHLAGVGVHELAAFVSQAASRGRSLAGLSLSFVQVEVDSLAQLHALCTLPAGVIDIVLLDNMNAAQLREACGVRDAKAKCLELEASGGVNLETIAEIAASGVDRISVGALTHSAVQLDVGLDFE